MKNILAKLLNEVEYNEDIQKDSHVKDSMENLCLYLNEIERIINDNPTVEEDEINKYRLNVLEKYILELNKTFNEFYEKEKSNDITLS